MREDVIYSDFSGVEFNGASEHVLASVRELDRITTLDAPHRIADAIFRDNVTADGTPFREVYGRAFEANIKNATALFELCPSALLFGTWDSTGSRGGLGNKFARALVSEVVGIDSTTGVRTSSRLDPLAISSKVPIYEREGGGWTTRESEAVCDEKDELKKYESKNGKGNPSAVNHSNVTPDIVKAEREGRLARRDTPLRIFFVVDRRIVVDGAYQRALHIAAKLRNASDGVLGEAKRLRGKESDPSEPSPTLDEIRAEFKKSVVETDREVAELVGRCLWDVFSDNHDVIGPDGRLIDIGSFRGAGGFIADELNWQTGHSGYGYSPESSFAKEREEEERREDLAEMRQDLADRHRDAVEIARAGPPPWVVSAYQNVYGKWPKGWPPELSE